MELPKTSLIYALRTSLYTRSKREYDSFIPVLQGYVQMAFCLYRLPQCFTRTSKRIQKLQHSLALLQWCCCRRVALLFARFQRVRTRSSAVSTRSQTVADTPISTRPTMTPARPKTYVIVVRQVCRANKATNPVTRGSPDLSSTDRRLNETHDNGSDGCACLIPYPYHK